MPLFRPLFLPRALSVVWALAACPLSALLLFSHVTTNGLIFAIAGLLLGIAPGLAFLAPSRPWLRGLAVIAFGGWCALAVWLFQRSPDGHPRAGARVQNRYTDGGWHYSRFALGALLPEIDQFALGFPLIPALDPLFTRRQAEKVSHLTRDIYADLEADPDFHALGSVMPDVYADLWRNTAGGGHYFLYIPPQLDRSVPAPVLIFLHGSGGNFKAYTWLLSRIADEHGMILIAPSGGMGNWEGQNAPRAVAAALEDAAKVVSLSRGHVHLAGLSNGGLAVSRTAASEIGVPFRSLIFLSPVFDEIALLSHHFVKRVRDRPVLIITGQADDRVPLDYVTSCAATVRSAGAKITFSSYPNTDHFLFFSERERFLQELSEWLKNIAEGGAR